MLCLVREDFLQENKTSKICNDFCIVEENDILEFIKNAKKYLTIKYGYLLKFIPFDSIIYTTIYRVLNMI
jgi:hypothetical protein